MQPPHSEKIYTIRGGKNKKTYTHNIFIYSKKIKLCVQTHEEREREEKRVKNFKYSTVEVEKI